MTIIDESMAMLDEELDLINGGLIQLSQEQIDKLREKLWERPWLGSFALAALVFLVLVFGTYGLGYDASAFIYGGTFN